MLIHKTYTKAEEGEEKEWQCAQGLLTKGDNQGEGDTEAKKHATRAKRKRRKGNDTERKCRQNSKKKRVYVDLRVCMSTFFPPDSVI